MTDAGLQAERTALAWARTGAVAAVNAALLLRAAAGSGATVLFGAAALLMLLTVGLWGYRRHRFASASTARQRRPPAPQLRLLAGLVMLCGLLVLAGLLG
ncbi:MULTISPECIES: DUF202 domain-containing protein [Polymorphospora]|uniref:DUF202 domain-containing protein n=1 Tax=Polymorphospora lycopeni TaxID=3140240 RepID=A0ABV5CM63_9ACTN